MTARFTQEDTNDILIRLPLRAGEGVGEIVDADGTTILWTEPPKSDIVTLVVDTINTLAILPSPLQDTADQVVEDEWEFWHDNDDSQSRWFYAKKKGTNTYQKLYRTVSGLYWSEYEPHSYELSERVRFSDIAEFYGHGAIPRPQ